MAAKLAKQKRAAGRSLGDFLRRNGKVLPAEEDLLAASRIGEMLILGDERPPKRSRSNLVRGEFIRFLALGGDDTVPVHEQGVLLQGAWVCGDVNLEACSVTRPLWLHSCRMTGDLRLADAQVMGLDLEGTHLREIDAPRLRCHGDLALTEGFTATHEVSLVGAKIGGAFDCEGGRFEGKNEEAECKFAIACDGAEFANDVFLSECFTSFGEVGFIGARIGGDIYFGGGIFQCASPSEAEGLSNAVTLRRARIAGALYFNGVGRFNGRISLADARIATLHDDLASWDMVSAVNLDGLQYERIDDDSPVDVASRTRWLDKQQDADLKQKFKPQPWEQMIKVLRASGYAEEGRAVAIEKQKRLRSSGKITGLRAFIHDIYGFMYGYGYRPSRLAALAAAIALAFAGIFWLAADRGVIVPTDRGILAKATKYCLTTPPENWTKCDKLKPVYTVFNPVLYSVDLIFPLAGFNQARDWAPSALVPGRTDSYQLLGVIALALARFEYLFGWLAGLMFAAVASGFVKKD
jgi:hypothetical protein